MPMNNAQARVVDPVLTTHARGYRQGSFVGNHLFPHVTVRARGGKVIKHFEEAFELYNIQRAPGGKIATVEIAYGADTYTLTQDALQAKVPTETAEEAAAVPGIDVASKAVTTVMEIITKSLEIRQATLATTAGNYGTDFKITLSGSSKWSHADAKPATQIRTAREVVRAATGVKPNVLVCSPGAWNALVENPSVIERFKYTSRDTLTPEMMAAFLQLDKVVIGEGTKLSGGVRSDIWGNFAVLAYVPQGDEGSFSQGTPSYGYTYVLNGGPQVKMPYWDNTTESWLYPTVFDRDAVLTGMNAGYLFTAPA